MSELDIKKLWGLAAGICSKPSCNEDCVKFLNDGDKFIIGEMAHVIAESEDGPRGEPGGGDNSYENLILLCPTHHREVDKAPKGVFPKEMLYDWKEKHEKFVRNRLALRAFENREILCSYILKLLSENYQIWKNTGPESEVALKNPMSLMSQIWELKKFSTIIPNNNHIIDLLKANRDFFSAGEYEQACQFIDHAETFELNTREKREPGPRFPQSFKELMEKYGK